MSRADGAAWAAPAGDLAGPFLTYGVGDVLGLGDWAGVSSAGGIGATPPPPGGPVPISLPLLALSASLMLINGAWSHFLDLGLGRSLAVGTVRVVLQLSLLGMLLGPVFRVDRLPISAAYVLFMLSVASIEAASRPSKRYGAMIAHAALAMGVPTVLVLLFGLGVVIRPSPSPWSAQYLIPISGMLLGNACSAVAIALSTVLDELTQGKDALEALLASGASRREAAGDVLRRAVKTGLTPAINQMNVAGIVAIPGLMTGQILGGSDPVTAARYQIVLLLYIAATSGAATILASVFAGFTVLDSDHRLRVDVVHSSTSGKGIVSWASAVISSAWRGTVSCGASLKRTVSKPFLRDGATACAAADSNDPLLGAEAGADGDGVERGGEGGRTG